MRFADMIAEYIFPPPEDKPKKERYTGGVATREELHKWMKDRYGVSPADTDKALASLSHGLKKALINEPGEV